uniref:Uncharacterized protein n=1 Tax=Anguilla anguilla TaxID=7936 RepID=A0A0E9TC33_ANGAN
MLVETDKQNTPLEYSLHCFHCIFYFFI